MPRREPALSREPALAPPGVIVDAGFRIFQFLGPTADYLAAPASDPPFDVVQMARAELRGPLDDALREARQEHHTARRDRVPLTTPPGTPPVDIVVVPLENLPEPCYLVLFEPAAAAPTAPGMTNATARLAAIVTASDDAIISKDLDGVITSWNRGAENLFGYTAEEMIGTPVARLIPADHMDEEPNILERIRRGDAIDHYETVRQRKDGSRVEISLSVSPLRDGTGKVVGASKIARDITERRRAEAALRRTTAELAEADRRKDEFLAVLAHELRNPLAPLRNALQVIRLDGANPRSAAAATEMMERQVALLVRLVDDLLDVSRITRGKIELRRERIDAAALIEHAVEAARPLAAQRDIALDVRVPAAPVAFDGDSTRLVQVLGNLLNNALKFTPSGGRIEVSAEESGDSLVLRVRDNGIGLAADQLERVFDMFTQVDVTMEREAAGLGIGLTLVKSLVEIHGGTVVARSAGEGQGATFEIRLPLAPRAMEPVELAPVSTGRAGRVRRRVLVVDDNHDAATSLAMVLRLDGHETRLAHDGVEALAEAESFRPEVVLLDIGLPRLNGFDVARTLRQRAWARNVWLIALTGWAQDADRKKSSEAGVDVHFAKPVDPDALARLLDGLPAREAGRAG